MDTESSTLAEVKSDDSPTQSSEQTPIATKKTPAKVPEGFKLVKVRKPDGTIKTVLRPIAKDEVVRAPSTSALPAKGVQPAQPITISPSTSSHPPKAVGEPAKAVAVTPKNQQPPKQAAGKFSSAAPLNPATKGTVPTPGKTAAPPAQNSKLDAVSKSSRIFRRFHGVRRHTSRIVATFDPDIGDYEDGDMSYSEDSHNDSGSQSDDSDRRYNQRTDKRSAIGTKGRVTAANAGRNPTHAKMVPIANSNNSEALVQNNSDDKSSVEFSKGASVIEKEVLPGKRQADGVAPYDGARALPNRSADWGKLVVWALVILFPLAFIGKWSSLSGNRTNSNPRSGHCHGYLGRKTYDTHCGLRPERLLL
jgi:hypothetical protein